jgi:hypothetical protein
MFRRDPHKSTRCLARNRRPGCSRRSSRNSPRADGSVRTSRAGTSCNQRRRRIARGHSVALAPLDPTDKLWQRAAGPPSSRHRHRNRCPRSSYAGRWRHELASDCRRLGGSRLTRLRRSILSPPRPQLLRTPQYPSSRRRNPRARRPDLRRSECRPRHFARRPSRPRTSRSRRRQGRRPRCLRQCWGWCRTRPAAQPGRAVAKRPMPRRRGGAGESRTSKFSWRFPARAQRFLLAGLAMPS